MDNNNSNTGDTIRSDKMYRPSSAISRQEADMMKSVKKELANVKDPMERLRLICFAKGTTGILSLGRAFRVMDNDGNRQLNKAEFYQGLYEQGLNLTEHEAKEIFNKFDTDHSGGININEFLVALRPPLPESRLKIIKAAFTKLDKNGEGEFTIDDLKHVYNVKSNPRYISGEDSEEMILHKFMGHFEGEETRNGVVTDEEFKNYYAGVSASIDNDCYFDLMIRQAYKL